MRQDSHVWWLKLAGLTGFGVLLGSGFIAWRRNGSDRSTVYMTALFSVGLVVFGIGVYLLVTGDL
jgi:hypothetical protein